MAARVRVKFCGIRTADDLAAAIDAGADAVGFNFHPGSPRYVHPDVARELARALPPFVEGVGVFVQHSVAQTRELLEPLGRVTTIQVHGGEPEVARTLWRFVPAFAVRDGADLERIDDYLLRCREKDALPSALLVDGFAPGLVGGTGQTAPWALLAGWHYPVPLILAGGLTPDNVADAIRQVRPYAVDVAGGIESAPGRKDAEKMRRFIEAVRNA